MYINVQNAGTAEEFSNKSKKGIWIILYYANWCPHCQMMKPEWEKFAEKYKSNNNVNVAEVESEFLNNLEDEHKQRIQGYPTVTCAKNGKVVASHDGPRTSDSFNDFANSNSNIDRVIRKSSSKKTKKINMKKKVTKSKTKKLKKTTKK
jgi:thiol-disulfide isomerase/thioredoxin